MAAKRRFWPAVLMASLGAFLPIVRPLIRSVGVGGSFEQVRVFVEIIPREVADVVREPFESITHRRRPANDAVGSETLNDTIVDAERVCASIFRDVIPENLLFIFCQTLESLCYAPIPALPDPPCLYESEGFCGDSCREQSTCHNERKAQQGAVVFCKLRYPDTLKKLALWKEKDCRHYAKRYEITWREPQEFKECFGDVGGDHLKTPNVELERFRICDKFTAWVNLLCR